MGNEKLLEKSNQNDETGTWAEGKKYFDVAVSRYYYSVYQKMLVIAEKRNYEINTSGHKGSHVYFTSEFIRKLRDEGIVEASEFSWLNKIVMLKKLRVKSDYKNNSITNENDYKLSFKCSYNAIQKIFDKLT